MHGQVLVCMWNAVVLQCKVSWDVCLEHGIRNFEFHFQVTCPNVIN
jgi:hypothetical protein